MFKLSEFKISIYNCIEKPQKISQPDRRPQQEMFKQYI